MLVILYLALLIMVLFLYSACIIASRISKKEEIEIESGKNY